jgi:hypothetical protein
MAENDLQFTLQAPLQILPPTEGKVRFFLEIHNRYRWLLKMGGQSMVLLKRKWQGVRCSCWDPVRKQTSTTECPECLGTQFIGGYHDPINLLVSFVTPSTRKIVRFDHGAWKEQEATSWMAHEPEIIERDILVDQNNKRYEIVSVTPTIWRGAVLRQNFTYKFL